jgi:hypothetical protein
VPVGRVGRDEQLTHPRVADGLTDRLRPLHEEPPGPIAPRPAQQLAGCDDAGGAVGAGRVGLNCDQAALPFWEGTLARASSTSAVKAAGSLMAISDRFLRSTSTPAILRPWMKRL